MNIDDKNIETQKIAETLAKIKHKIAVFSGKGGTGKTTVTVNIAQTLSDRGFKVGILDADITGPNIPLMLGVENEQLTSVDDKISPVMAGNIKLVSMEFLLQNKNQAIIWRGPMKIKGLKQLISDVDWGELDFLVIDLPPGSSDEPLSIVQTINDLDGMVIVTTPQAVSLLDVSKSINFAEVTNTKVLGIVENMSGFKCGNCNEITYIFSKDGGKNMAEKLNLPFLGAVALIPSICQMGDLGKPAVTTNEEVKQIYSSIVENMLVQINKS